CQHYFLQPSGDFHVPSQLRRDGLLQGRGCLRFAMNKISGLWLLLEGGKPAQQLFSIGMVAELLQGGYMRTDRHFFREDAHCPGSALDGCAACAWSLKAD